MRIPYSRGLLLTLCLAGACGSDDSEKRSTQHASPAQPEDAGADATEPDPRAAAEPQRWVGEVQDSDAQVGIVADADHARLFFCGGDTSYATATRWFALDVTDGAVEFEDEQWRVSAKLAAHVVDGSVQFAGERHEFSANAVAEETLAGVYEGQAQCGRLGLIVMQSAHDSDVHTQGACLGADHDPQQVNPILPVALTMREIAVEAPGEPDVQVGLLPLSLP